MRPLSFTLATCFWLTACTAVQPIADKPATNKTAVELHVQPERAEIYVDGEYRGRVEGWRDGILPLEPGDHRLELRADGYIDQRFDLTVESGETHTLDVTMEPSLSRPLDAADASQ